MMATNSGSLGVEHDEPAASECVGPVRIPTEVMRKLRFLTAGADVDDLAAFWVCATVLARRLSRGTAMRARVMCGRLEVDGPPSDEPLDHSLDFRAALRRFARSERRPGGGQVDVTILLSADRTGLYVESGLGSADGPHAHTWVTAAVRLLTAMVTDPDAPIGSHRLVDADERDRILHRLNPYRVPDTRHRTMAGPFEDQVERTPDSVALVDETGVAVTYRELNDRANRLAHYLIDNGAGSGTRIGICLERGIDLVVAIYAAVKTGAGYVPLDVDLPDARLAFMLADSAPSHVITDAVCRARIPAGGWTVINLSADSFLWQGHPVSNPIAAGRPTSLLHLLYTSGTTGQPKGVATVTAAALANCAWMQHEYPFADGDTTVFKTSPGFDVSIYEIFWPLYHGARLLVCRPGRHRDSAHLARLVEEHRVTFLFLVPTMLASLLTKLVPERASALRWMVSGGESMAPWLREAFYAKLPASVLVNAFGPTEAGPVTDNIIPAGSTDRVVPVGRQAPNFRMIVLDENLDLVPVGTSGELYLGGEVGLADGYWRSPARTAERFVANLYGPPGLRLYRTGDLCRFREDGRLEHLGRIDRQIKIRGQRIEPGEIESVLAAHPTVAECAVVVPPDPPQRLLAFVVLAGEGDVTDLDTHAASVLPEHLRPRQIVPVDEIPATLNGKIDEAELIRSWQERTAREPAIVPPADHVEATLMEIYSRVLATSPISALDRFAQLGGHSLLAFDVLDACESKLHVQPDVTELLTGTVRDVAASIRRAQTGGGQ